MSKYIPETRKKIDEVIARYKLEPELKDIYLEGETDKTIVELFLDYEGLNNVKPYDISSIDFTALSGADKALAENNRLKLITFGDLLHAKFNPALLKVRCVIDKDFAELLNEAINSSFVLLTDYCSIEGYLMDKQVMDKFLKIGFKNLAMESQSMLESVQKICLEYFLIRCTRISTKSTEVKLINIENGCVCSKQGSIEFNLGQYIDNLCKKNVSIKTSKKIYLEAIENHRKKIKNPDLRHYVHGHDFVELLFKLLKVMRPSTEFKLESFTKAMFMALEVSTLKNHSLFQLLHKTYF